MKIYFSGSGCAPADPEIIRGKKAHIMLTFADMVKRPSKRFLRIHKLRTKKKKKKDGKNK